MTRKFWAGTVSTTLREAKVNKKKAIRFAMMQKVCRLDVAMDHSGLMLERRREESKEE